ncbi:MAG: discoidin domain-containing protein [Verrucomicrobiales bacterium]
MTRSFIALFLAAACLWRDRLSFKPGEFAFPDAGHLDAAAPGGWQLRQARPEGCRVGRRSRQWHQPRSRRGPPHAEFALPPLDERESKAMGDWTLVITADLIGSANGKPATLALAALDPATGDSVAGGSASAAAQAPAFPRLRVSADNAQPGHGVENATDGDPESIWHTAWSPQPAPLPHHIQFSFGKARKLTGFVYLPRQSGSHNGTAAEFKAEVSGDGKTWREAASGSFKYTAGNRDRQEIAFAKPEEARFARLVITREVSGQAFASAAEVAFTGPGLEKPEEDTAPRAKVARAYAVLPPEALAKLGGKVVIQIGAEEGAPVVAAVSVARVHEKPSGKLFGRSNGGLGPDKLGCGALGFDALTEHGQRLLTAMAVRPDSPASRAGLREGDIIAEINNAPLPENDLAPGWRWLAQSHEATLGHAIAAAYAPDRKPEFRGAVRLTVLRGGKPEHLTLTAAQPGALGGMEPDGAAAKALHADLIAYLVREQRADGSWGDSPIRTALGALALLATRDTGHAPRIKSAVDWMLNRYPNAEDFGNLGFWFCGYAGILYGEYHLATGDPRVLPRMEAMLEWPMTGLHTSKWNTPALGHGPSGLPYGQKALVAPAIHLLVFESLAQRCGLKSRIWEALAPYMESAWSDPAQGGHGAMGYNASYKDLEEFWSRSGLFAAACLIRGERADMAEAMGKVMRERHPWIRNSHAYGEPGGALGLVGLHAADPAAYRDVLAQYAWWFHLAWEPGYGLRFTTPHMGAPYMGEDELLAAGYGVALAAHRRSLHLTGAKDRGWLDVSNLPTAASGVLIRRAGDAVTLAPRVPGVAVRYTLDGSEPTDRSPLYESPVPLPRGGEVKARAFGSDGAPGAVAAATFGLAKSKWRIVNASGSAEPADATRRAAYAIDGDPALAWFADVGEGAGGFPHHLVIDLGESVPLAAVELEFMNAGTAPDAAKARIADSPEALEKAEPVAATFGNFQAQQRIEFGSKMSGRYLRLDFDATGDKGGFVLREIDAF